MIARGCRKAYALDGGQTATTAFGGVLINPVQFGQEKEISDLIYFASALGAQSIPQESSASVDSQLTAIIQPEESDQLQTAEENVM